VGRERPFVRHHPWVFSGAIQRLEGSPEDGDEVHVCDHRGGFVAHGLFNGASQIRVRLYSWESDRRLDDSFFDARIEAALVARDELGFSPSDACRLVFSESDGLSGLVVDRYADWLTVQFTSLALWMRREVILDALERRLEPRGIVLRTEKGIGEEEGLVARDGPLRGDAPEGVTIEEGGLTFRVDLATGQKTGFYLDQRDNRSRVARLARDRRVADVFCYSGGFTLPALRAGAVAVTAVDSSAPALALAFRWLEGRAAEGQTFDMVVLDPPRFARSSRGVKQALRGYRRLNELAVQCLEPGGVLATCSCTGRVTGADFLAMLGSVEERTGRRIRVTEVRGQAPDHPVSVTCPETAYLKCVICRIE
jgi:23S rRNA (cytosine1962-C5)-methyltransferase